MSDPVRPNLFHTSSPTRRRVDRSDGTRCGGCPSSGRPPPCRLRDFRVGTPREPLTLVGHHVGRISLTDIHPVGVRAVRWVAMLSIAKLRVGQEAYQLSGVAQSLDDYYTGAGEATGVWVGGGAARLGLDGEVDPDDLRAVLAGLRPGLGWADPERRHAPAASAPGARASI